MSHSWCTYIQIHFVFISSSSNSSPYHRRHYHSHVEWIIWMFVVLVVLEGEYGIYSSLFSASAGSLIWLHCSAVYYHIVGDVHFCGWSLWNGLVWSGLAWCGWFERVGRWMMVFVRSWYILNTVHIHTYVHIYLPLGRVELLQSKICCGCFLWIHF